MTAKCKFQTGLARQVDGAVLDVPHQQSLFHGDGADLFSSGSNPSTQSLWTGDRGEMFSSGSTPRAVTPFDSTQWEGEGTEMFSSGSAPAARSDCSEGVLVEMFSSGSAPRGSEIKSGSCTGLFSSGS